MPNGNPAFNLAEQETWFAPLAQAIGEVAGKHNLLLDKYYHEGASWDLRFNHPRGGQAAVTIYNGGAAAQVGSVWYLDDYDLFTRFIYSRPPRQIPKQSDSVRRELEIEFTAVLASPVGEWTEIAKGYERIWSQYSKAEFQAMARKLPDPTA